MTVASIKTEIEFPELQDNSVDKIEVMKYLFDLQDSGRTNMWGAPTYVEDEMGLVNLIQEFW